MKRTALVVAMLLAVAATFLYLFGVLAVLLFAVVVFILTTLLWVLRLRTNIDAKSALAMLAVVLIAVAFAVRGMYTENKVSTLNGKIFKVEGIVTEERVQSGDWSQLTVEVLKDSDFDRTKGMKFLLLVRNTASVAGACVGDIVSTEVAFERIDEVSAKNYSYRGIYLRSFCNSAQIVGHKTTLYGYFVSARQYIRKTVSSHLVGDSSALLKGLLLGDKTDFSDELYYNFKACGLSHIVAISGLHINIISLALYFVVAKIFGRRKASALMFLPLIFVVAVTGFTPSAVRAGIMFGLFLLGKVLLKNPDTLNSLGVAVAVMLCFNPYYIASISFQLSVSATAGVILCGPIADKTAKLLTLKVSGKRLKRVMSNGIKIAILSVAACAFTLPFSALHFGFVSVVAPIVSVFVTPAATYTLVLGALAVVFSLVPFIGYYLSGALFILSDVMTKYMAIVAKAFSAVPFSYIPIDYKTVYISLVAVLCLVSVWILLNRVGGKRVLILMSAGLLCLGLVADSLSNINCVRLTVVDADVPSVVLVKNGKGAVIGLCEENRLATLSFLKMNSVVELETVVMTNISENAEELLDGYKVNRVVSAHDAEKGHNIEVLNGVEMANTETGFSLKHYDKIVKFIKVITISEAKKEECDLCVVKFPSGNIKAFKNGEVIGDAENELSFKISKGKDVVCCG